MAAIYNKANPMRRMQPAQALAGRQSHAHLALRQVPDLAYVRTPHNAAAHRPTTQELGFVLCTHVLGAPPEVLDWGRGAHAHSGSCFALCGAEGQSKSVAAPFRPHMLWPALAWAHRVVVPARTYCIRSPIPALKSFGGYLVCVYFGGNLAVKGYWGATCTCP